MKKDEKLAQTKQLLEMLAFYRGLVMDACEAELGDSPNWKFMRSRLLKIFGEKGMQQKILQIMGFLEEKNSIQSSIQE